MSVTTEEGEIVIRIPNGSKILNEEDIEALRQFLKIKSLQAKSKVGQKEVEDIASTIKKGWWAENREEILKNTPRRN